MEAHCPLRQPELRNEFADADRLGSVGEQVDDPDPVRVVRQGAVPAPRSYPKCRVSGVPLCPAIADLSTWRPRCSWALRDSKTRPTKVRAPATRGVADRVLGDRTRTAAGA